MKYDLKKKIIYSIIILALLFGMSYVAVFGMKDGYGSIYEIKQGLDLIPCTSFSSVCRITALRRRFTKKEVKELP